MKTSFEQSVNYLAQFLDNKKSFAGAPARKSNQRNVSGVHVGSKHNKNKKQKQGGKGNSNNNTKPNNNNNSGNTSSVNDGYYKFDDWNKLSKEQQQRVQELRSNRDKRRGFQAVNSNKRQRTI